MFDQSDNFSNRVSASFSTRYYLIFLILFGCFTIFFNLGGRALENKDYFKYPEIAWEILESNDWTILRSEGEIYVDKPPLHFWLIAGMYKIFGVTPFAARVPAALAALAGLLMAFFLGRKIFQNSETGFLSALMLLSAYGYFWWARRTRIDMEFAVFFSLALIFFYYGLEAGSNRRKSFWYMAFWLATGLAFMDKAFIALSTLIVVIPYSVMVSISKNDARQVSPFLFLATSPVLALPILPWVVSLINHPDFSDYWALLEQTKIMTRQRGFFYYFYAFPAKFFPAFPFLLMGIWAFFKYRKEIPERYALVYPLIWILPYLAMLHLTAAKNTRYLLPIFLPCALVSAWSFQFYLKKAARVMKKVLHRVNAVSFVVAKTPQLRSFVVEWDGQQFKKILENDTRFFRVLKIPHRGAVLLGQRQGNLTDTFGENQIFSGPVSEFVWRGGSYAAEDNLGVPARMNLYSFALGDIDSNGQEMILSYSHLNYLRLSDRSGAEQWQSGETFGSSDTYLEIPDDGDSRDMDRYYLPSRIIVTAPAQHGAPSVLVVKNTEGERTFPRVKTFKTGHIEYLAWNGLSFVPAWRTQPVASYISDFALGDLDHDGQDELVFAVVVKTGSSFSDGKSTIVFQDVPDFSKPSQY